MTLVHMEPLVSRAVIRQATCVGVHQELQATFVSSSTMNVAVNLARMGVGVLTYSMPILVCAPKVILESTVRTNIQMPR